MKSYPFTAKLVEGEYDRVITSALERQFNKMRYTNGVFSVPTNGLQITAGTGMSVNANIGGCNIEGAQAYNESILPIVLSASNVSLPRIDRIVVRFDLDDLIRSIEIYKKEGTFSSTPVAPSIYTESNYYELVLADIYVPAGATEIVASNITDQRLNSELCGLVVPAIPEEIDTTDLFNQYQDALDTWLAVVDAAINETLAGQLQTNIDAVQDNVDDSNGKIQLVQKYNVVSAVTNGDFKCTLTGLSTLTSGDVVKVSFPSATDKTKVARLSIDGGTTYKNIYADSQLKASLVESKKLELMYNGTQFIMLDARNILDYSSTFQTMTTGSTSYAATKNGIIFVRFTFTSVTDTSVLINGIAVARTRDFNASSSNINVVTMPFNVIKGDVITSTVSMSADTSFVPYMLQN